jgi:hypothetical protein
VGALATATQTRNSEAAKRAAAVAALAASKAAAKQAEAEARQAEAKARTAEKTAKLNAAFIEEKSRLLALSDLERLTAIKGLTAFARGLIEPKNSALLRKVVINDATIAIAIFRKSGILSYILTTKPNSNQRQLLIEACKAHSALLPTLQNDGLVTANTCDDLNTEGVRRGGTRAKKQKRNCNTKRRHR